MLLELVSDIDPQDEAMINLELLASRYGIFNMTVVLMKIKHIRDLDGQRVPLYFDETTYRETVGTLLSLAILNFAAARYGKFLIPVSETVNEGFFQNRPPEAHVAAAHEFLLQAAQIIDKYEQPS